MYKRISIKNIFLLTCVSLFFFSCSGGVRGPASLDDIIHISVKSNPSGGDVYWRIVSMVPDVKSTNRAHLGSTPYNSTRNFVIAGLTEDNLSDVTIVIEVEKRGYHGITERLNLSSVLNDRKISLMFHLSSDK